ncbi:MAG: histidinol-phosphatase [Acuticoccus sp.]
MQISDVELAHRLADDATSAIEPLFRALPEVENKAAEGFDPVTEADRAAEHAIRQRLAVERPEDGILGEEYPPLAGSSGRTWVLDPIDGTRAFMTGMPTWGVLIALAEAEGPTVGMMAQPFVGERFFADAEGVFHEWSRGRQPMRTRACRDLSEAVVACTSPDLFDEPMGTALRALTRKTRLVRYGTDCYAYAMLAAGHVDIVLESGLKPFDIAPFVPIVERAGGMLVDRRGERIGPTVMGEYGGDGIAVGDPHLLEAVLKEIP